MLDALGLDNVRQLYAEIPTDLQLDRLLNLPQPIMAEWELEREVSATLAVGSHLRPYISFLGAGTFPHAVPAVVDEIVGRSEFLTAYAGEAYEDHGRFQALFEYQSVMAELVEMDVVTVPTYDGYQAAATGLSMATRITGRGEVVVASVADVGKYSKIRDYLGPNVVIRQNRVDKTTELVDLEALSAALTDRTAAVYVETPNFFGALEPSIEGIAEITHSVGANLVVGTDPICLGVVRPPATLGADITCGDIQSLGVGQWYGGAHGGFIAVNDIPRFVFELPSRLFGLASTSVAGEYGFGDVAYTRTSFAKREEGKEWVGTAAALWGIAAAVYLSLMGPQGMAEIGNTVLTRTKYAMERISRVPGLEVLHSTAEHFREFVIDVSNTGRSGLDLLTAIRELGIEPGVLIHPERLLVCVTEIHSQSDIDSLISAVDSVVSP
jgi:glycine dehydrogenase subunit 1